MMSRQVDCVYIYALEALTPEEHLQATGKLSRGKGYYIGGCSVRVRLAKVAWIE